MARSYKKEPVSPNAGAESEKKDKQRAHGAQRVHFRAAVSAAADGEDVLFDERNVAHSHVWAYAKDGRHRLDLRVAHLGRAMKVLRAGDKVRGERHAHQLLGK